MECIQPNRKTVLDFLRRRGTAVEIHEIRFMLDASHGCIWPVTKIERVLKSLQRDGLVVNHGPQGWAANPLSASRKPPRRGRPPASAAL